MIKKSVLCAALLAAYACGDANISINGSDYILVASQSLNNQEGYAGELPDTIKEILDYVEHPAKYHNLGIKPSTAFLLVGPPGSGKTSLVKALAQMIDCKLVRAIGSDFVDKFVGVGAQRVRELFDNVRNEIQNANGKKVILFIDEIDAIGNRHNMLKDDLESARTVNAMLAEVEDMNKNPGCIIVAATNYIDNIDPALLRPGRFDKAIRIGLPQKEKRIDIMKMYSRHYVLAGDVNFDLIGELTNGFTPADLEQMVRDAGLKAVHQELAEITMQCFVDATQELLKSLKNRGDETASAKMDSMQCALKNDEGYIGDLPDDVSEILSYLEDPTIYDYYGIQPPKGVMISGPSGVGKTSMVRMIARRSGSEFIMMSGTEFVEQYFGVGAKRMRELFDRARARTESNLKGKVILFIDEIDAIGSMIQKGEEYQQTLAELLLQMDGATDEDNAVMVFGATRKPNILNPQMFAPGRFDMQVRLSLPDVTQRKIFFKHFCERKPVCQDETLLDWLAESSHGFTIGQIRTVVNTAARLAMHRKEKEITRSMFEQAIIDKTMP